ncbi:O-antigen polymerase [Capnocytophaga stomatis]|uniref:O-antigen polymerase n=1 Tax=Capnocytophaga stomatis TaxID=1848904 RepID=UPI001BB3A989|nr:O-antigen polymerase [Capnocytophaga stomatis]
MIIKVFYIVVIVLLFSFVIGRGYPDSLDSSFVSVILLVNFFSLFFFFLKKENLTLRKQYIKISSLFIIGFIIVHFQMYIDFLLGLISEQNSFLFINNNITMKALLISSIAFNSYLFGYSLKNDNENYYTHLTTNKDFSNVLNTKTLLYVTVISLILFFITVDKSYLAGNYGKVEKGGLAGTLGLIFQCGVSALLVINAQNLIIQKGFGVSLKTAFLFLRREIILLCIFTLSTMVSGERNILIFNFLFLVGILLYITKLRLSKLQIFLFMCIASFCISLLGAARRFRDEGTFFEKINLAFNDEYEGNYPDSFFNSTKELAGSGRTLNIAVDAIESGAAEHTYGLFAIQDLMLLIPSLKGSVISLFGIPGFLTSSSHYLTYINLGANATWGVGSSCVADTYLDFGLFGVGIVFFLFGFFTRKLELIMYRKQIANFFVLTVALLILSSSIYMARGTILYGLNKLFYIMIFIYSTVLINKLQKH